MTCQERTGRVQDFDVRYRFLTPTEGGRSSGPPHQGYRSDWAYDGDYIEQTGTYMIWPEFEDETGKVIPQGQPVPATGHARMWIVVDYMKESVHRRRIAVGVKGYFMEGSKRVAEAEVINIAGLAANKET